MISWILTGLLFNPVLDEEHNLLDAFAKLSGDKQIVLVKEIEEAIQQLNTPLAEAVNGICKLPEAPKDPVELWKGPEWFDPKTYAPALPIARKLLPEDSPKCPEAQAKFLRMKNLYDLEGVYRYSIGYNKIWRLNAQASPKTRIENYLKGYPPGAEKAREILLSLLDENKGYDEQAKYFEHAYSDRDGFVYPGIVLYDVWNSGMEIEMPDIDAIPFARHILKDNSFKSPIPAGAARTSLYQKIGDNFQKYRRYRELREAIAGYYLAYAPPASPFVEPMKDRFHFLIAQQEGDPMQMQKFLQEHPRREDFIEAVDALIQKMKTGSGATIQKRKFSLEDDHQKIRDVTLKALREKLTN